MPKDKKQIERQELKEEMQRTANAAQSSVAPENPPKSVSKHEQLENAFRASLTDDDDKTLHQRIYNLLTDMRYNTSNPVTVEEIDLAINEDMKRRITSGKILSDNQAEIDLLNAIKTPVDANSNNSSVACIGNWGNSIGESAKGPDNIVTHYSEAPQAKDTPVSPADIINNTKATYVYVSESGPVEGIDPLFSGVEETATNSNTTDEVSLEDTRNNLGYYDDNTEQIVLYEYSPTIKDGQKDCHDKRAEFIKGNKYAQQQVFYHEMVHAMHQQYDGDDEKQLTLINTSRTRNLTERTAYVVEYLNAAEQYNSLKNQGITEVDPYNTGELLPSEHILEMNNGLKEIVLKDNFNLNDNNCLREIAAAATKSWDEENKETYDNVIRDIAAKATPENRGFTAMKSYYTGITEDDKVYQTVADRMLKDVLISENTFVDLTCCKDIIDNMPISEAYELAYGITPEEMNAINTHLEKKGLKTDKDKEAYLDNYFKQTTNRTGNPDNELTEILLSYNNNITYADNLVVMKNKDKYILWDQGKETYLSLSHEEFYNLSNEKSLAQNNQNQILAQYAKVHSR